MKKKRVKSLRKKYGVVKGFRLQPTEEGLLTDCFYMLNVEGENFNQKMLDFIPVAHKAIKRLVDLEEENKQLKEKVEKLVQRKFKVIMVRAVEERRGA